MTPIDRNLLLRLHVKRRALLHRYDEEALHQLRVALRRVRSRLRHIDSAEAQNLRHDLGQLADATSAARDWDTLAGRARASLKPRKYRCIQLYLEHGRTASHEPVLDMLRSQQWTQAMGRLETCIDAASDNQSGTGMARAKQEVHRAWCEVQSQEDNKHWHKLRLAIKELRYTLDSVPRNALEPSVAKTLKHGKKLQEMLGTWHDTVVHLRMVRAYADSLDAEVDEKLLDVLKVWCKRMKREAGEALDEARSYLEGKGSDLLQ